AADISPMITFGTTPGMAIPINALTPSPEAQHGGGKETLTKSLAYMGFAANESLIGKKVNYVFVGSCTNGRIEDLREFASIIKGKQKADNVTAYIVPGSQAVLRQALAEGIDKTLAEAGFELRQPGCSACLAMNDDKIPSGEYCVSTSNRNFEGRQGPGARTLLASPALAAVAAITGEIRDVRDFL
ncbi:MAG: 3-isopropylmalate dehydratase, large subunit, partial [Bacteroidota bacterium]